MNSEFEHITESGLAKLSEVLINDAILAAFGSRCMIDTTGRRRKVKPEECREAWQWIESDDDHPFSFVNCAEVAGLDPFPIREQLRRQWREIRNQPDDAATYDKLFVNPISSRKEADELFITVPQSITGIVSNNNQQQFAFGF